jgi:hypothetical protein
MELLFLVAFAIGRHPAAATVHMAFQATLPLLLVCYGLRFGFPRVGIFAGLLIYACPVVGINLPTNRHAGRKDAAEIEGCRQHTRSRIVRLLRSLRPLYPLHPAGDERKIIS